MKLILPQVRELDSVLCRASAVLGLTVIALTRGMGAMMRDDKRKSQRMMRQRVAFQLLTVGAVVGGMYWRAYQSGALDQRTRVTSPAVDNRVFITNGRNYDLPADATAKAAEGAEAGIEGFAPEAAASTERELR